MSVDGPSRLASIDEGAARAGLHPKTVRRYIKEGRLTGYRVGVKFLRVDLDEIDGLIQPERRAS